MSTVPAHAPEGRDRRRRLSVPERRQVALRAGGRCQNCSDLLGDDWHNAHLLSWSNGGPTDLANIRAWCATCNLKQGSVDAISPPEITLRAWQDLALPVLLERLYRDGVATLHAAPGAGKTLFAGLMFRALREVMDVERMIVAVPNSNLRGQWKTNLARDLGIHLDDEPRDGWMEHRDTLGCVVTYQSLPTTYKNHRMEIDERPTFFVADEVHHVGEKKAWGKAVTNIVGDVTNGHIHAAAVLNMTGTLFRSTNSRRISTVRYRPTPEGKIEATADYSIFTKDLIPTDLRPPDVYTYGAQVKLFDLLTEEVTEGDIADLDERQQQVVLGRSYESAEWLEAFAAEAVRMLNVQMAALDHAQVLKLLFVATNQRAAKLAADALNRVVNDDFARLVISDEPAALKTLRRAAQENRSLAIVTVKMVTEGFDCPPVSTVAYASNVTADLSIAQTMARAMRITETERRLGRILPAQILIPDHAGLKAAFARALIGQMHLVDPDADDKEERERIGTVWRRSGLQVLDLSAPVLRAATVMGETDGEVEARELNEWITHLRVLGVPETFAPKVVVASRRTRRFPRLYSAQPAKPTTTPADPRVLNKVDRAKLDQIAGWMAKHIDHDMRFIDIAQFQGQANQAGGIPNGERDMADREQLAAAAWMTARIYQHADECGCEVPRFLEER